MTQARRTALALAAGLTLQAAAVAQSADRPWYVLTSPTNEIDDFISTTTLRGGINQTFGRQRLFANAALNHQRFQELKDRNNNGYNFDAGVDWSTVERLSGTVRLYSTRRQTDFNVGGIVPISLSNLERADDLEFRARLGVVTKLGFEAGVGQRRLRYSAFEFAPRQYDQNYGSLGISYRPSGILGLSAGVGGAKTKYKAPEIGQSVPDRARRSDVFVAANWVPTGASTVDARLAYTKQEFDRATSADFGGMTGNLRWTWKPSGRLSLTTVLLRDLSQDAGFLRLDPSNNLQSGADFAQTTNELSVLGRYELTGKIIATGGVAYAKRKLVEGFTGAVGRDNTTTLSAGLAWAATRTITAGCGTSYETRSGSGTGTADFDATRVNCYASVTID
jgi:Putative beta-barrel porin 2